VWIRLYFLLKRKKFGKYQTINTSIFRTEDTVSIFLPSIVTYLPDYTVT